MATVTQLEDLLKQDLDGEFLIHTKKILENRKIILKKKYLQQENINFDKDKIRLELNALEHSLKVLQILWNRYHLCYLKKS